MSFYTTTRCNIPECTSPIARHLLCERHAEQYLTDEASIAVQQRVERCQQGRQTVLERLRDIRDWWLHHVILTRISYPEHFPCEALFLHHFRPIRKSVSRLRKGRSRPLSKDDKAALELLDALTNDFDVPANIFRHELRVLALDLDESATPPDDPDQYRIEDVVPTPFLLKTRTLVGLALLLLVMPVATFVLRETRGVTLPVVLNLSALEVAATCLLLFGFAYFGLRFIHAITPAAEAALEGSLYQDEEANAEFLDLVYRRYADALIWQERFGFTYGVGVGTCAAAFLGAVWGSALTAPQWILVLLLHVPLALLFLQVWMIYPIISGLNALIWEMPRKPFAIVVFAPDQEFGIQRLTDLLVSYLAFNSLFFVLLMLALFAISPWNAISLWNVLLVVMWYLISVVRSRSVRIAFQTLRRIRAQVEALVGEERSNLSKNVPNSPFVEQSAKYAFLSKLRYRPFSSTRSRRICWQLISMVLVPLGIVALDRNLDFVIATIKSIFARVGP